MGAAPKHRDRLVTTAVTLFRKRGYAATGINDILKASGAPKGSFYHYFPDGKEQLGEEALGHAAAVITRTLRRLRTEHGDAASVIRAYGALLGQWMAQSGFNDGCPLTTTLLETVPASPAMTAAGRRAFAAWREDIRAMLIEDGIATPRATILASLLISTWEGALIQARVDGDATAITLATEELAILIERR